MLRVVRERAGHRVVLDMVGRSDIERGVVVLESDERAVYCLPGRRRRTVVTTGTLRALDDVQLAAVLAHERAHLAERHTLVLAWSDALAFPRIPLFRDARAEVARLVELRADDVAATSPGRRAVAEALLQIASGRTRHAAPAAALAG
ncbi:M56 family metallopeptidase, partial [Streptomyces sp. CT34]|uniref:M56 family metallopeptidase n=1 Tax=Streptomyces sp. CT34 TaxID=1553907 RepID=UPI0018E2C3D5